MWRKELSVSLFFWTKVSGEDLQNMLTVQRAYGTSNKWAQAAVGIREKWSKEYEEKEGKSRKYRQV